jgi:Fe-S-cluster containining protein
VCEADIVRLAQFLDMSLEAFEKRYVYRTRLRARLRTPRNAQCHFLRDGGCAVHPAKPVQCRTFPFWPELVDDAVEWHKTGAYCPGIGKGDLVQIDVARAEAQAMREAHPLLYK